MMFLELWQLLEKQFAVWIQTGLPLFKSSRGIDVLSIRVDAEQLTVVSE